MIPDLGKYAADVLSAYGIALTLLAGLVLVTIRQATRARKALDEAEKRARK